jgi:Flp pilus assembly protein TadG
MTRRRRKQLVMVTAASRPAGSRRQRGQSVVELALILPMLLFIVLGTLDLGRLFISYDSVLNAAHEGAFYAAYNPSLLPAGVVSQAAAQDPGLGLTASNVTVTCYNGVTTTAKNCSAVLTGDTVSVVVTYPFRPFTAMIADIPGIGSTFTITATVKAGIYASAS